MFQLKTAVAILAYSFTVQPLLAQLPEPLPEHDILKQDIGEWNATIKIWMGPDGKVDPSIEPMVSEGIEKNRMLGSFWVVSTFKGEFGGMPFEGQSMNGFDPKLKKFVGSWIDSTTPYPMHMVGEYDAETKTLTSTSTGVGFDGEETKGASTLVYKDKDHRTMTMYEIVDGKNVRSMQIEYERKK